MAADPAAASESVQAVGMIDFLENDRRPTFVIDFESESAYPGPQLHPVFYNFSLRKFPGLQQAISQDSEKPSFQWPHEQSYAAFKRWVCQPRSATTAHYSPATFRNMTWDATTVGNRYNVISARLGARPYTSSFMETLLIAGPARRDTAIDESNSSSVTSLKNRHTPATDPSSTDLDDSDLPHARKVSESYFSYTRPASPLVESYHSHEFTPDNTSANVSPPRSAEELATPDSGRGVPAARYMQLVAEIRARREDIVKKTDLLDRISAIEAVAISVITADGELVYANDEWYRMCSFPKGVTSALAWMNVFLDEDLPKAYEVWETAMVNKQPIKFEARFKTVWNPPFHVDGEPDQGPTWISAAIYPDLSEDGEVVGGTGCIIDVSEQKWLQRVQVRKVDEAVDRAKLLEEINKQAAEAQLRAKEAHESDIRFQRLAEMMPIGIFIANKDRLPVYANRKYYDLFDIAIDSPPTTTPWEKVFFPEDIGAVQEFWEKLVKDQVTSTFEARMRMVGPDQDPTGHRWILCTGIPETHGDGSLKHITGCIIDFTKIKEAEELQRQRVKDVTEARKQQEAFIDMTSHEIRNPLSSIVHSADEVIQCLSNLPAVSDDLRSISVEALGSAQEAAETILFCTQHSKRIIDDILCLSKLNSNLLPISLVPAEARMAAEQVMKMFEGELRSADIDWKLDFDDSLDRLDVAWVNLDTSRILQILVNLIGNSVKFTRFEDKPRRLRVSLTASLTRPRGTDGKRVNYLPPLNTPIGAYEDSQESVFLEYIVEDTGCGISSDGQKMLFNRFTQDSARTHVKYGGNGLGLFISRQLCELQGGQMGFRSVEGQGSTFGFFVRTVRVDPPETKSSLFVREQLIATTQIAGSTQFFKPMAATSSIKIDAAAASIVPPSSPKPMDIHILLVEDNLINQKVLGQQLRKRGYTVSIANHGEEALSHIQTTRLWAENKGSGPDLTVVLMDIEMPVLDGLGCARRIREYQQEGSIISHIPIVAVTANARSQQIEDTIQAGMDNLISKPFRMPELVALIDTIVDVALQEQKG